MSNADWKQVRKSEVAFPSDLVHNGHQYIRGCRRETPALTLAVRRIRNNRRIAELQAEMPRILRVHRVEGPGRLTGPFLEGCRSRCGGGTFKPAIS
jgi:hypothetical protein